MQNLGNSLSTLSTALKLRLTRAATHLTNRMTKSFSSQCLLCACHLQGELLCVDCQYDLPHTYGQLLCQQCGLRIHSLSNLCGNCLHHPPAFTQSFMPFAYDHPLDSLIHTFKYNRNLTSGKALGKMLADSVQHRAQDQVDWVAPDIIVPVPLHWLRRWQRGFNQAEILAHALAKELHIPLASHIVYRSHRTPTQKGLSRTQRQKNLRHTFAVKQKHKPAIKDKRIAIVDDVVTTTATVRELSDLLVKSGAKDVQVWALARTM